MIVGQSVPPWGHDVSNGIAGANIQIVCVRERQRQRPRDTDIVYVPFPSASHSLSTHCLVEGERMRVPFPSAALRRRGGNRVYIYVFTAHPPPKASHRPCL